MVFVCRVNCSAAAALGVTDPLFAQCLDSLTQLLHEKEEEEEEEEAHKHFSGLPISAAVPGVTDPCLSDSHPIK